MAFAALSVTAVAGAAPTVETIYRSRQLLDGAAALPDAQLGDGNVPVSITGDVVRSNGQDVPVALPNGDFITPVGTGDIFNTGTGSPGFVYLFGSTDGGQTPRALHREGPLGGFTQVDIGPVAGIDYNGATSYSAVVNNPGATGPTRLSVLYTDDAASLVEGDPFPAGPLSSGPGGPHYSNGVGGVYRSPDGVTSWVASYAAVPFGDNAGSALMRGATAYDVLLRSGDTIPGLGTIGVDTDFTTISIKTTWSQLGANYITEVGVPNGGTNNFGEPTFDGGMVLNGAALTFSQSGAVLKEQSPLPAVDGGLPGETFFAFQGWDVNESGDWAVAAFTDNVADAVDQVLIHNGELIYREGETVDGVLLDGQVQGVGLNDRGDLAFAWNDHVFINGQAVAGPGTLVETPDLPGATLGGTGLSLGKFEITNLPAAGGDGLPIVYFAGEVEFVAGPQTATFDVMFRLAPPAPLDGDYNGDGVVDAADYTVWRDTDGSNLLLAADGDDDTVVDADDYTVWANGFGGSVSAAPVPEGGAACLALMSLSLLRLSANRRR